MIIIIVIIIIIFVVNKNDGGVDSQVLSVMERYYEDVSGYQKDYVFIANGEMDTVNPFNTETKEYLDGMSETMTSFKAELSSIKSEKISKDFVRSSFDELCSDINMKEQIYADTVNLYNLFYEYINNKSSESKDNLLSISESFPEVKQIIDSIDLASNSDEPNLNNNFLQEIFKIYYRRELTEIYYYEYMGDIIGGLKNVE